MPRYDSTDASYVGTPTVTFITPQPTPLRSITAIISDLSQPIPNEMLQSRRVGGTNISFISWHNATVLLDKYATGWSYTIKALSHVAGKVVLIATISIPTLEGVIVREATGNEDDVTNSFGDPFSNSESMALRRACAKFGLGRYLYSGSTNSA